MADAAMLKLKDVKVDYRVKGGFIHALRDVSISINAGESVAIVGESGCGKSTLASSLMLLLAKNASLSGSIEINGRQVTGSTAAELEALRGAEIGMIFQDPAASLNPLFTVKEQLEETIMNHRKIRDKKILEETAMKLLEDAGITEIRRVYHSYPHQLSGGQQQRVMIAIALSCSPKILVADEPTTALDVTVQAQIIALLKRLKEKKGLTLILITHDLHLAVELCSRVVVMYAGEIAEDGAIANEAQAKHPYTRALFEIIPGIRDKKRKFKVIPGAVPDLRELREQCSFYGRCSKAQEKCSKNRPMLENGVRCFYPY